ncbi:MAG: hypothetical protein C4331_09310 [Meiothermus sp.]
MYNWALEQKSKAYQESKKGLSRFQLDKKLSELKKASPGSSVRRRATPASGASTGNSRPPFPKGSRWSLRRGCWGCPRWAR